MTMDKSLATNGLPELSLDSMDTTNIGGDSTNVSRVCNQLNSLASETTSLIGRISAQGEQILSGWSGAAATEFSNAFPELLEAFKAVPGAVESISAWASSTMNSYVSNDADTAAQISSCLK